MMCKRLLSGHEVEELTDKELKNVDFDSFIHDLVHNCIHGLVRIKPDGWLYHGTAPAFLDRIHNVEFRSDDVLVTSFPKCGTTWVQEIIWTMLHNPKLDNPKAKEVLWLRSPEISMDMTFDVKCREGRAPELYQEKFKELCPGKNQEEGLILHLVEAEHSPRILKSHYPISLLPRDILDRAKVVYVARNPKDMAVSLFYFIRMGEVFPFELDMEKLFKSIVRNEYVYCPFWPHVKVAWEKRHHPNLLFLFYEEMKADIMKELRRINEFIAAGLSQESLEAVARHTTFSAMKSRGEPQKGFFQKKEENKASFFRKGTTGDWKNHFSPEMQKEFDEWTKENLAGSDLSLSWALAE